LFRSAFLSILLHGLLLAFLCVYFQRIKIPPITPPLIVDLPRGSGTEREERAPQPAPVFAKKAAPSARARLAFGGLNLKPRPFSWEGGESAAGSEASGARSSNGVDGQFLSGRDVRAKLFQLVENALPYPEAIFTAGKSGKVLFTATVNKEGRILRFRSRGGNPDLEAWVRSGVEGVLESAQLPGGPRDDVFELEFYVNDSFPDAAGPVRGNRLSFYRSDFSKLAPMALFQSERSKADPLFYRNREPQVEVRIDPARILSMLIHPGLEKRKAEERLTLERELMEARDKRRKQEAAYDAPLYQK